MSGFHYIFQYSVWIFLIFLGIVSEHRLSFSASCSTFIIFSSIVSEFSSSSSTSCPSIAFLFRHCVRLSLSFPTSCSDFPHLPQHRVRASLIFFGIVSSICHYLLWHRVQIFLIFLDILSEHRLSFLTSSRLSLSFLASCPDFPHLPRHRVRASLIFFGIMFGFLLSSLALFLDHSSS